LVVRYKCPDAFIQKSKVPLTSYLRLDGIVRAAKLRCGVEELCGVAAAGETYVALIAIMVMKSAAKIAFLFKLHFLPAFRILMRDHY
jgi:hypothetical protein